MFIVFLSFILMLPYHRWYNENYYYFVITRLWQCFIQGIIPCTTILFLSAAVYKKLKELKESAEFKQADEALRKSVVRARLQLWISTIFVTSQFFIWIRIPFDVRYKNVLKIPKLI